MKKIFLFFVAIFFTLHIVNIISHNIIFDRTSYELPFGIEIPLRGAFLPWLNFDGINYLTIAKFGYEPNKTLTVFFPFYPFLIRIFSINLTINPILVGLFISYAGLLISLILLYRLIETDYDEKTAFKTILLMLLFPTSFYFFAYYTESLFLLLSVLTFWFLKRNNTLLASTFCGLATATRLFGLALMPALIFCAWQTYKKNKKKPWFIVISPAGIIFYMVFNYFKYGNAFFMIMTQTDPRFARSLSLTSPIKIFWEAITKIIAGPLPSYDSPFVYPVVVLEFIWGIFALAVLYLSFKKLPVHYFLYVLFSMLFILFGGSLSSIGRYLLLIFPIFIYLARHLSKKIFVVWSIISFLLLIFASSLFLRNYWIA